MQELAQFVRRTVKKVWGRELVIQNSRKRNLCLKVLEVRPGFQSSCHRHLKKSETFIFVSGDVRLEVWDPFFPNTSSVYGFPEVHHAVLIPAGVWHQFQSREGGTLMEVSTFHSDRDVERRQRSGRMP